MTTEMKSFLLARLQEAVDEAVAESDRIGEIVDEMKRSGYDVSLMLESTVLISPTEDYQPDAVPEPRLMSDVPASNGEITLTDEDLAFLQELNIAVGA
jgi:hypothetical protein